MDLKTYAALFVTIVVLPTALAIPDPGLGEARDRIITDNPWAAPAVPCREESVLWNGLGAPAVDAALATAGDHLCEKLALDATVTTISAVGVDGEVSEDGQLTLRVVFPLIETPILTPFRNQNPDSQTFVADAARDAAAPVADWVPIMLDPNAEVPCVSGTTGTPRDVYAKIQGVAWGAHLATCEDAGATTGLPIDAPNALVRVGDSMTVPTPRKIGMVQRLFLVQVTGIVPLGGGGQIPVYETAFTNLALINNMATETLANLRSEVESTGHALQETVFQVTAYLSEAAFAVGDSLDAYAPIDVPTISDKPLMVLDLPTSSGASSAASASDAGPAVAQDGGCQPSGGATFIAFTYENGCVTTRAYLFESDKGLRRVDHQEGTDYGDYGSSMVERIGSHTWIELPPHAGLRRVSMANAGAGTTVRFKIPIEEPLAIHSVWRVDGDVRRLCDASPSAPTASGYCVAGGAELSMTSQVRHLGPGATPQQVDSRQASLLPSAPLEWCEADVPFAPEVWTFISVPYCFIRDVVDGMKAEVDASNDRIVIQTIVVDPQQYPGYFDASSDLTATIRGTSGRNIPSFHDIHFEFVGFVVEAA